MGAKPVYDEIEPFSRWRRGEESDILEVHLPAGSKKEQLKVQINNLGTITITGECPIDQTKLVRFHKDFKVSKACRRNEIRAKFNKGVLRILMPKTNSLPQKEGMSRYSPGNQMPRHDGDGLTESGKKAREGNDPSWWDRGFTLSKPNIKNKMVAGIAIVMVVAVAAAAVIREIKSS